MRRLENKIKRGEKFEGETAQFLDDNGVVITEFSRKFGTHEIDFATEAYIVECKTNLNNRSAKEIIEQVE